MADSNIEEVYVYAEFNHFGQTNILKNESSVVLSDIFSEHPKATTEKLEFAGEHRVNLGSLLFFEKRGAQHELFGHTIKKLRLGLSKVHHDVVSDNEQNDEGDSDHEEEDKEEENDGNNGDDQQEIVPIERKDTTVAVSISDDSSTNNILPVETAEIAEI